MRRWVLPACAMALRMKCTRQRCQVALNILVMAAFSPSWGIRHDELDAAQAASGQAAQEVRPERFSFAVADGHAQHFAAVRAVARYEKGAIFALECTSFDGRRSALECKSGGRVMWVGFWKAEAKKVPYKHPWRDEKGSYRARKGG